MSSAENKKIMQNVFSELANGNGQLFIDTLADDVSWTIAGSTKWSKTFKGKQAVQQELFRPMFALFAEPYRATASRILADDDYVVVEASGKATTRSRMPYNNSYCWIYRFAGGKIHEVTEYLDTDLVNRVLG
jgi:ketosteroid isomerase-like protein